MAAYRCVRIDPDLARKLRAIRSTVSGSVRLSTRAQYVNGQNYTDQTD